ncbi:hypothetical protein MP228_008818 [Amoeboaphelidium protococcarum]|nr:hypothetical protein MP228_008818 [Amoeboaphelidium protococcarum]
MKRSAQDYNQSSEQDQDLEDGEIKRQKVGDMKCIAAAYRPPALQQQQRESVPQDASDDQFQRVQWESLKKSINGLINRVNVGNLRDIVVDLFSINVVRGRGLLCKSLMKAQVASPAYTNIYAALISVINSKLPAIGQLLIKRLIYTFQRGYQRSDKKMLTTSLTFLAHLINQQVAHEIVALQIIALLLEKPTDDSVEMTVALLKEVGAFLVEVSPKAFNATFDQLKDILHEGASISKRVQYSLEVLFQIRKDRFKEYPSNIEDLDLIEEEEQITHFIGLDDVIGSADTEETLDMFMYDDNYAGNEQQYEDIKREILGEEDEDDVDEHKEDDTLRSEVDQSITLDEQNSSVQQQQQNESDVQPTTTQDGKVVIYDKTDAESVALRKKIYLTLRSSLDFEEACHKLLLLKLKLGQDQLVSAMVIECAYQESIYEKFYGLIAERLCKLNRKWSDSFADQFHQYYSTIHRYETNRVRIIAKLFAHLLHTDALAWNVLDQVELTEESTTSSSRIFLKVLFQELNESMGKDKLKERLLEDRIMRPHYKGLFPDRVVKDMRFAINYWTSINLGYLTDEMRDRVKQQSSAIQQ